MINLLASKHLKFTLVQETDAAFIVELRNNIKLNKYLSKSVATIKEQKQWIIEYKKREHEKIEFYFKINTLNEEELGFIRIYNIDYINKTFTWGSWIIKEERPSYSALESALLIYKYAFEKLHMEKSYFDVRKENIHVLSFHKKMGAIKTGEDSLNEYFEITKEIYENSIKTKYKKYL